MSSFTPQLQDLFNRIPRRHTNENVKEIYALLDEYEDLLLQLEVEGLHEKEVAALFDALEPIRITIKKSNDNKASKKMKDTLFDEASVALKDAMEAAMQL